MHSITKPKAPVKKHRVRKHIQKGVCVAAVRALAAAKSYMDSRKFEAPTLGVAARNFNTSVTYIEAAIVVLKAVELGVSLRLVDRVTCGHEPLLDAAARVRAVVELIEAHKKAPPEALAKFDLLVGAEALFDRAVETEKASRGFAFGYSSEFV